MLQQTPGDDAAVEAPAGGGGNGGEATDGRGGVAGRGRSRHGPQHGLPGRGGGAGTHLFWCFFCLDFFFNCQDEHHFLVRLKTIPLRQVRRTQARFFFYSDARPPPPRGGTGGEGGCGVPGSSPGSLPPGRGSWAGDPE